jgi:hypothetical protein
MYFSWTIVSGNFTGDVLTPAVRQSFRGVPGMSSNSPRKRLRPRLSSSSRTTSKGGNQPLDRMIALAHTFQPVNQPHLPCPDALLKAKRDETVAVLKLGLLSLPETEKKWFTVRSYQETLENYREYIEGVYYRYGVAELYWRRR